MSLSVRRIAANILVRMALIWAGWGFDLFYSANLEEIYYKIGTPLKIYARRGELRAL